MIISALKQELQGLKDQEKTLNMKLEIVKIDISSLENEIQTQKDFSRCEGCSGWGSYTIDFNHDIYEECRECEGKGYIE